MQFFLHVRLIECRDLLSVLVIPLFLFYDPSCTLFRNSWLNFSRAKVRTTLTNELHKLQGIVERLSFRLQLDHGRSSACKTILNTSQWRIFSKVLFVVCFCLKDFQLFTLLKVLLYCFRFHFLSSSLTESMLILDTSCQSDLTTIHAHFSKSMEYRTNINSNLIVSCCSIYLVFSFARSDCYVCSLHFFFLNS